MKVKYEDKLMELFSETFRDLVILGGADIELVSSGSLDNSCKAWGCKEERRKNIGMVFSTLSAHSWFSASPMSVTFLEAIFP